MDLLQSAKNGTKRRGKKELIKHLEGKKLTWGQAIRAKCYDCNGMGEQKDCDNLECPLILSQERTYFLQTPCQRGKN